MREASLAGGTMQNLAHGRPERVDVVTRETEVVEEGIELGRDTDVRPFDIAVNDTLAVQILDGQHCLLELQIHHQHRFDSADRVSLVGDRLHCGIVLGSWTGRHW